MILLRLALLNIFRHKTRSLITLSTVAFGCISIILIDGFFNDMFYNMRESTLRQITGHIQINRRGFSEKGAAQPYDYLIENPKRIVETIRALPGIEYISMRLHFGGMISTGENNTAGFAVSIEPKNENFISLEEEERRAHNPTKQKKFGSGTITSGEPLDPNDEFGVLLGEGLATNLGVAPGAGLILVTNTVGGSMNALDVKFKGTFRTSNKDFDDRIVRVPLGTVQKLLQTESVQSIIIVLDQTDNTDQTIAQLQRLFAEQKLDFEIKHWRELNEFYVKTRQLFGRFMLVLIVIVTIVVVLSIFNTMSMAVMERTNEIGTLRAIGQRRQEIVTLFLLEGLLIGTIGGLIGVLVGGGLTELFAQIGIPMPPPPQMASAWISRPRLSESSLITAALIAVVSSVLSSIYPARRASRLEIADALRHVS